MAPNTDIIEIYLNFFLSYYFWVISFWIKIMILGTDVNVITKLNPQWSRPYDPPCSILNLEYNDVSHKYKFLIGYKWAKKVNSERKWVIGNGWICRLPTYPPILNSWLFWIVKTIYRFERIINICYYLLIFVFGKRNNYTMISAS